MFEIFKKKNNVDSNYLFVIGTGRSGTHFIGRAIGSHPNIDLLLEDTKNFNLVKKAAVFNKGESYTLKLVKHYKAIQQASVNNWILEKSHPNIWLTDTLIQHFPNSYFLGMQRNVYQVVNSMLSHDGLKGVKKWFEILPHNKPSRFLGINAYNISYYKELPIEAKCVIRWLSHTYELKRIKQEYPNAVTIFDYDRFCLDFEGELHKVEKMVGLDLLEYAEKPKLESLKKFENLNKNQMGIISETMKNEIGFFEKQLLDNNK